MNFLSVFGRVGFFVCLFVCLSVCLQDYLKYNEQICMKFLPASRAKDQIINFGELYITVSNWLSGICYILRSGIFTSAKGGYVSGRVYLFVCPSTWYFLPGMYLYLGPRNNPVNCVDHLDYDPAAHFLKIIVSRFNLLNFGLRYGSTPGFGSNTVVFDWQSIVYKSNRFYSHWIAASTISQCE